MALAVEYDEGRGVDDDAHGCGRHNHVVEALHDDLRLCGVRARKEGMTQVTGTFFRLERPLNSILALVGVISVGWQFP